MCSGCGQPGGLISWLAAPSVARPRAPRPWMIEVDRRKRPSQPLAFLPDRPVNRRHRQRRQPVEHAEPGRDEEVEKAIPRLAHGTRSCPCADEPPSPQFDLPDRAAFSAAICDPLPRVPSPRSSIRSCKQAASSSASARCLRISRLAARQISRLEITAALWLRVVGGGPAGRMVQGVRPAKSSPTLRRWPSATAPRWAFPIGARGFCAPAAAVGRWNS